MNVADFFCLFIPTHTADLVRSMTDDERSALATSTGLVASDLEALAALILREVAAQATVAAQHAAALSGDQVARAWSLVARKALRAAAELGGSGAIDEAHAAMQVFRKVVAGCKAIERDAPGQLGVHELNALCVDIDKI